VRGEISNLIPRLLGFFLNNRIFFWTIGANSHHSAVSQRIWNILIYSKLTY